MAEKKCCPEVDPKIWDEKEYDWNEKVFVRDTMLQFYHMPFPGSFGRKVEKMWQKIEKAGAKVDDRDFLMLSSETSPWKGELLINATKEVPEADNIKLSGKFLTKVFDGPYNAVPKWISQMDEYVKAKGKKVEKYYFYYTTCPKCAKKYGHNYVVVFAQVS